MYLLGSFLCALNDVPTIFVFKIGLIILVHLANVLFVL